MVWIDSTVKSEIIEIESRLPTLKIQGKDGKFGKILVDIYGKGKEWEFLPHQDHKSETRLAFREAGKLTYVNDFGDGLRCAVGILGTAMSLENTAMFVEEIENHQHIGALVPLIKNLVAISQENNLQLFISTHNRDVWNTLENVVYEKDEKRKGTDFRCFIVDRDHSTGRTIAKIVKNWDDYEINRALAGSTTRALEEEKLHNHEQQREHA